MVAPAGDGWQLAGMVARESGCTAVIQQPLRWVPVTAHPRRDCPDTTLKSERQGPSGNGSCVKVALGGFA